MDKEKNIVADLPDEQQNEEKLESTSEYVEKMQGRGDITMEGARRSKEGESLESENSGEKGKDLDFSVDPNDYPIFSRQAGNRVDFDKKIKSRTLSINETLGLMTGRTADTVAMLSGDMPGFPKADHVIYLDKSARPVSWLVNEFWDDFTTEERPDESFLAIDRRPWFHLAGVEVNENMETRDNDGSWRKATEKDFWEHFDRLPKEVQNEYLAKIRSIYIEGGIETEDVDTIMATPTSLDGKNLVIIDEVSNSGATLGIAKGLLMRAIGMENSETGETGLKSVNGHVFWSDLTTKNSDGQTQMGNAPVWYPSDSSDWRGRGVKDINPAYFERQFREDPSNENRALKFGSIVLGEPLVREEEPGDLSWKLREEMRRMHSDYQRGKVLPTLPQKSRLVKKRMINYLMSQGVEFVPADKAEGNSKAYINLLKKRDKVEKA